MKSKRVIFAVLVGFVMTEMPDMLGFMFDAQVLLIIAVVSFIISYALSNYGRWFTAWCYVLIGTIFLILRNASLNPQEILFLGNLLFAIGVVTVLFSLDDKYWPRPLLKSQIPIDKLTKSEKGSFILDLILLLILFGELSFLYVMDGFKYWGIQISLVMLARFWFAKENQAKSA